MERAVAKLNTLQQEFMERYSILLNCNLKLLQLRNLKNGKTWSLKCLILMPVIEISQIHRQIPVKFYPSEDKTI